MDDAKKAALAVAKAVYETIVEAGEDGAPSGVVYAALMTVGCDLETYEVLISKMVGTGLIEQRGDVLYAVKT